ncbi:hypothetical protein SDC9_118538 [bioreactor metagenome]|uniref:Uncharacterized protein n=1 Tax=bioreactor metagenome TaxID=1076179 RepID=A0A645C1C9_9ZZZZ
MDPDHAPVATSSLGRNLHRYRTCKILAGDALLVFCNLFWCPLGNDIASMYSSPWTKVNQVICLSYGCLIVFYHKHGVAKIPQVLERIDEFLIISLVQPNGRFIQNIQNPAQSTADLGGKTDTLGFSSTQRRTASIEGEIVQSDVTQKRESAAYLFQNLIGDGQLILCQGQIGKEFVCQLNRESGCLHDIQFIDCHRERFSTQPITMTSRACLGSLETVHPHLDLHAVGLVIPALQIRDDTGKGFLDTVGLL